MQIRISKLIILLIGFLVTLMLLTKSFVIEDKVISGYKLIFGTNNYNGYKIKFSIFYFLLILLPMFAGIIQLYITDPFSFLFSFMIYTLIFILILVKNKIEMISLDSSEVKVVIVSLNTLSKTSLGVLFLGSLLSFIKMIDL